MNVIDMLEQEHREVEHLFGVYGNGSHGAATEIVQSLTMHTQIEEQIVYPAIRQHVDGGDDMVDHAVEEHGQVKEMLARFEGDHDNTVLAEEIKAAVEGHVAEEESEIFPALREVCNEEQLTDMGQRAEQMKAGG